MPLMQPPVTPLPQGQIDLSGQTAIVTGASSGLGLEMSRQLLDLNISTLVLAVRNVAKGEAVKKSLLAGTRNTAAQVEVMRFNAEDYASVRDFASAFRSRFADLHIAMLNAGIGTLRKEFADATGHERDMQTNYLANVPLTLEILPLMDATAERTGRPGRLTWTTSRMYQQTSLFKGGQGGAVPAGTSIFAHIDTGDKIASSQSRYGNSKLLCILFLRELASRRDSSRVIINSFCPGPVRTAMADPLPFYLRIPINAIRALIARTPEHGTWIALHAALVAGAETHGKFLMDKSVDESEMLTSAEAQQLQKRLWNETIDEMNPHMKVPDWMSKV